MKFSEFLKAVTDGLFKLEQYEQITEMKSFMDQGSALFDIVHEGYLDGEYFWSRGAFRRCDWDSHIADTVRKIADKSSA
jgi:hypothetical protein